MPVEIHCYSGQEAAPVVPDLARLRIEVFREFPYLYEGTLEHEQSYLRTYLACPASVLVVARDGHDVVGISTGLPLEFASPEFQRPFDLAGIPRAEVFYFGESVLRRAYRGQGLGVRFFAERESFAQRQPGFRWLTFCAVVRPFDHPRRPPDYRPLDDFWRKRGFQPRPEWQTTLSWPEIGDDQETTKPMAFWVKELKA